MSLHLWAVFLSTHTVAIGSCQALSAVPISDPAPTVPGLRLCPLYPHVLV